MSRTRATMTEEQAIEFVRRSDPKIKRVQVAPNHAISSGYDLSFRFIDLKRGSKTHRTAVFRVEFMVIDEGPYVVAYDYSPEFKTAIIVRWRQASYCLDPRTKQELLL